MLFTSKTSLDFIKAFPKFRELIRTRRLNIFRSVLSNRTLSIRLDLLGTLCYHSTEYRSEPCSCRCLWWHFLRFLWARASFFAFDGIVGNGFCSGRFYSNNIEADSQNDCCCEFDEVTWHWISMKEREMIEMIDVSSKIVNTWNSQGTTHNLSGWRYDMCEILLEI